MIPHMWQLSIDYLANTLFRTLRCKYIIKRLNILKEVPIGANKKRTPLLALILEDLKKKGININYNYKYQLVDKQTEHTQIEKEEAPSSEEFEEYSDAFQIAGSEKHSKIYGNIEELLNQVPKTIQLKDKNGNLLLVLDNLTDEEEGSSEEYTSSSEDN